MKRKRWKDIENAVRQYNKKKVEIHEKEKRNKI